MHVLVTGGTGFIGTALCRRLLAEGHEVSVLTRERAHAARHFAGQVRAIEAPEELKAGPAPQAIVNLAGLSLGSGRWNEARKREFVRSRAGVTRRVVDYLARAPVKPRVLVSGSAVGYYGARGEEALDEEAPPGNEFQADLCQAWETEALRAREHGVRVCLARMGVVLGRDGGALSGLLPLFRLGLGGWVGSGRQWMSWIHLDDVVGVFIHLIAREDLEGPFNATSPHAERNRDFAKKLGSTLHRPVLLRAPAWLVRLGVGEMARLYLTGQRVVPKRLLASGYRFRHPRLEQALAEILA